MQPNTQKGAAIKFLLMLTLTVIMGSPLLCAEELDVSWDKTEMTFSPDPRDKKVNGQFSFTNTGKDPITIKKITAPCGCTAVETGKGGNDNEEYGPSEKGHINFTLSFTPESGQVRKDIYVTLSDGNTTETTKLDAVVDASPYLRVKPSLLFWRQNENKPEAQTATITVLADTPIHLVNLESKGEREAFSVEQRTIEEGREYAISIKPHDTSDRNKLTLTLYTDFPSKSNPLTYKISASITPSVPASLDSPEPDFLQSLLVDNQNNQTLIVLGLSALVGTSIALLLFALTGQSDEHTSSGHNKNG